MTQVTHLLPDLAPQPPERIYDWMNSHLSVARFYSGITVNGHHYRIDYGDPRTPLVREDVIQREAKARRAADKEAASLNRKRQISRASKQQDLL